MSGWRDGAKMVVVDPSKLPDLWSLRGLGALGAIWTVLATPRGEVALGDRAVLFRVRLPDGSLYFLSKAGYRDVDAGRPLPGLEWLDDAEPGDAQGTPA